VATLVVFADTLYGQLFTYFFCCHARQILTGATALDLVGWQRRLAGHEILYWGDVVKRGLMGNKTEHAL